MAGQAVGGDQALAAYVREINGPGSAAAEHLRQRTATHPNASYQSLPEEGALLRLLVALVGARRCLDVGTFTGLSALTLADAMGLEGRVVTLEADSETAAFARAGWADVGVADRIELREGPAVDSLAGLAAEGQVFDLAFVDADKRRYGAYVEACLGLVRPGGVIAVDNALWGGRVTDPADRSPQTRAIDALNRAMRDDPRVDHVLLPLADGVLVLRKR